MKNILGKAHAFSGPLRNNTNLHTVLVHWPEYECEMLKPTYRRPILSTVFKNAEILIGLANR